MEKHKTRKIVICGSMSASSQMVRVASELSLIGFDPVLPRNTEDYASGALKGESSHESTQNKIDHDLIRGYFNEIKDSYAILVVNETKNATSGYIGGNTFLEIGFAHVLSKPIYLMNEIPETAYQDELRAMRPTVLYRDLSLIK